MSSGTAGDVALAMLAKDGLERLSEIIRCATQLPPIERKRALAL
jgi:hypothetical protein